MRNSLNFDRIKEVMTQRQLIRDLLEENPHISVEDGIRTIFEKYNVQVSKSLFYGLRSDMGLGSRRNGRVLLTADSINRVSRLIASTKTEGFASTLLAEIDELGIGTFKESLKVVAQMEKNNGYRSE